MLGRGVLHAPPPSVRAAQAIPPAAAATATATAAVTAASASAAAAAAVVVAAVILGRNLKIQNIEKKHPKCSNCHIYNFQSSKNKKKKKKKLSIKIPHFYPLWGPINIYRYLDRM